MHEPLPSVFRGVGVDPVALLHSLNVRARRRPGGCGARCPFHDDRTPSFSVSRASDGALRFKCFGCQWSGDLLGFVAEMERLDIRREFLAVVDRASALLGQVNPIGGRREIYRWAEPGPSLTHAIDESETVSPEEPSVYDAMVRRLLASCPLDGSCDATAYLESRGILDLARLIGVGAVPPSAETRAEIVAALTKEFSRDELLSFGLLDRRGSCLANPHHPILIPWRDRVGRIQTLQRRVLDSTVSPKYLFPSGRSPRDPFECDVFIEELRVRPDEEVWIVEGAFDALALRALGDLGAEQRTVLGLASATLFPDENRAAFDLAGRHVRLAFDNDAAGDRASTTFATRFCEDSASVLRVRLPAECNDINDWLLAVRKQQEVL